MDESGERTLRAKYLDWCSARLAERFLDLSPEEIYELARPERGLEGEALEVGSLPSPTEETYRSLVQRVTESLLVRTPLPTFEQWSMAYVEAPQRFDAELLGFWRDVVEEEPGNGAGSNGGSG